MPRSRKSCRSDDLSATLPPICPRHVAIIMDGNGRWAKKRHLPREAGHVAGMGAVRETVRAACDMGLENLTLFAFSSRELEAAQDRSGRADGPVPRLFPQRHGRAGRAQCPHAHHRPSRPGRQRHPADDRGCRKPHRQQYRPQPDLRLRLWRAGRDRRRRPRTGARRRRRPARSRNHHAGTVRQRACSPARCRSPIW